MWSCFFAYRKKSQFFSYRFRGFWNCDFHNRVQLLFKKRHVSECQKKISFFSNNVPEIHIFISWQHQKLLLAAKQLQDSTFLFQINSKDKGISKLLLTLLPSLFELKDNDAIVMSTIIKKLQDMSRNRSFLISKIVRLLLLSQVTNAESEAIFSALKPVITYLRSTMRNNLLQAL